MRAWTCSEARVSALHSEFVCRSRVLFEGPAPAEKLEEKHEQAAERVVLVHAEETTAAAREEERRLAKEMLALRNRLRDSEMEYQRAAESLRSVTSWDDIVVVEKK